MGNPERQPDCRGEAPAQRRGSQRYRAWQRLRGQRAFRRERNEGVFRHSGAALIRILLPWETTVPVPSVDGVDAGSVPQLIGKPRPAGRRLGVVASRKVGNAVVRNRAKRVWREIFRLNQHMLPVQCDVLVIVRKDFMAAKRAELDALFADVARRARRAFGASA